MNTTREIFRRNFGNFFTVSGQKKAEFARTVGISRPQLDGYLSGDIYPSFEVIDRIAEALKVTPGRLFEDPGTGAVQPDIAIEKVRQAVGLLLEAVDGHRTELLRAWETADENKQEVALLILKGEQEALVDKKTKKK